LTIGGYESAWLADLVAAYVLENTAHLFADAIYDGIYRDDGLVVFKGSWSKSKMSDWLEKFQEEVNRVTRYDGLEFTVSIWGAEKEEDGTTHEKVTVEQTNCLPFLDMKLLYWDKNENLAFTVYRKQGQQLKYLNKDSTHPPHVFRAIPLAVLSRLANLTSYHGTNKHKTMKDLHPDHCNALEKANLLTSIQVKSKSPTLHYMKQCIDLTNSTKEMKKTERQCEKQRSIFLHRFFDHLAKTSPPSSIESHKERHNLQWLRVSMSYHRFPNMRDIFQSQLSAKMIENVESLDFKTRDCNCRFPQKCCQYGNICRVPVAVYKVKCNTLGKIYTGNTQQFFKARMRRHFQDVKQYVEKKYFQTPMPNILAE
jgi:hypothetical protein